MSLEIEIDNVAEVLLVDGWHKVKGNSFEIDAYEFIHEDEVRIGGGQVDGVPSAGAIWYELASGLVACPLTSIIAVRIKEG